MPSLGSSFPLDRASGLPSLARLFLPFTTNHGVFCASRHLRVRVAQQLNTLVETPHLDWIWTIVVIDQPFSVEEGVDDSVCIVWIDGVYATIAPSSCLQVFLQGLQRYFVIESLRKCRREVCACVMYDSSHF